MDSIDPCVNQTYNNRSNLVLESRAFYHCVPQSQENYVVFKYYFSKVLSFLRIRDRYSFIGPLLLRKNNFTFSLFNSTKFIFLRLFVLKQGTISIDVRSYLAIKNCLCTNMLLLFPKKQNLPKESTVYMSN